MLHSLVDWRRLRTIEVDLGSGSLSLPIHLIDPGLRQRNSTAEARRLSGRAAKAPTTALASAIIPGMELHAHVRLSGDRDGEYLITEERPDGSLTLVPDTSFEAIRKRLGTEPGTLAEFEAEHGPVQPPDGEG